MSRFPLTGLLFFKTTLEEGAYVIGGDIRSRDAEPKDWYLGPWLRFPIGSRVSYAGPLWPAGQ